MKRIIILLFMGISGLVAQNLQMHYQFKQERKYFLSRFEMFKPDEYGSNYLFIDMEYNSGGNKGVSLAYWEINRYVTLRFIDNDLSATIQYNDGVFDGGKLGPIWLGGISYPINLGFTAISLDLLYRSAYNSKSHDFQITSSWDFDLMKNKLKFNGFIDFWSEDEPGKDKKWYVFLSQPQLWIVINNHLNIGGQLEISRNFVSGKDGFQFNPMAGIRWIF